MGGDLLHEPIREPLRIGDVAVLPPVVRGGQLEQAAERAGGVGVLVGQGEALPPSPVLGLPRRPVVLGRVLDLGQRRERRRDRLGVRAELREQRRQRVVSAPRQDRAVPAADAVGDRVERLPVVVLPVGGEHVVHDLARRAREPARPGRMLREPRRRQVGKQRLPLRDPDEQRRAGERHLARGDERPRLLGQPQQFEPLADQPLAAADELRHLRGVAVLLDEPPVRLGLLDRRQVGADHVLRDRERQRLAVDLPHLRRDLAQLRRLRRAVAALSRDDRVTAVAVVGERQRRDDPVQLHRGDEFGHPLVVEVGARVRLARPDPRERNHAQGRGHDWLPPSVRSASARSFRAAGSVARSKRASWWLRPAVARVGCTWST